jgi:hypothetical protein
VAYARRVTDGSRNAILAAFFADLGIAIRSDHPDLVTPSDAGGAH